MTTVLRCGTVLLAAVRTRGEPPPRRSWSQRPHNDSEPGRWAGAPCCGLCCPLVTAWAPRSYLLFLNWSRCFLKEVLWVHLELVRGPPQSVSFVPIEQLPRPRPHCLLEERKAFDLKLCTRYWPVWQGAHLGRGFLGTRVMRQETPMTTKGRRHDLTPQ